LTGAGFSRDLAGGIEIIDSSLGTFQRSGLKSIATGKANKI
jgi:hypothetical protein